MASTRTYKASFAGGELSPEMFGRIDDAKFQAGAALMRNFVTRPTGRADNRPGFAYVKGTKNNGVARLIPFTYSLNQTMVIELGDKYARFHTQGATLEYSTAGVDAWVPPSGAISLSYTTPTVVNWTAHGLDNGDPIRFYLVGGHQPSELPAGFQVGYTYTAQVIDANNFNIIDPATGNPVNLPASGGGGVTNYPGTGTADASVSLGPNQNGTDTSSTLGGLANVPISGGLATLNASIQSTIFRNGGLGTIAYQYQVGSGGWNTFHFSSSISETLNVGVQIPISNLNQLQLRVFVTGRTTSAGSLDIDGQITAWSVDVPTGAGPGGLTIVQAYRYYTAGDLVSYAGSYYAAIQTDAGGNTVPGTDATIWALLPADLTYEIPTPYAAADLFGIHYAQSADVLTLVHPNYSPSELRRLGATSWSLTPIQFGPPLATPLSVSATASPGFLARISSISLANPALITTASNHTLSLGDGVYVANLTAVILGVNTVLDGFYMVSKIPVDMSGNLILNELNLADYSGNVFDSSGWSSYHATDGTKPISIQLGTKIFNITNQYAVQAIGSDGVSASALSAAASILNNLDVPGSYNTIGWTAGDANAASYNVYKQLNGLWGFIGNTKSLQFQDNNIAPDFSIVPGTADAVLSTPGNYPSAVCYYQQRRCFGGTTNGPDNVWMTNSGTESMMNYSIPSLATDRIAFRVAALKADIIQHLLPMSQLIFLTSETEFALQPPNSDVVTPSNIDVKPQSYIGASGVQPTIINTAMIYAAARGGHVRELGYAWTVNGFQTGDLSLRAAHLFDDLTIVDQAYSKSPVPIIWFVSSSGDLLGLTYVPDEQIGAWHHQDTQGTFESICCVAEGSEDFLYAVVNRTIGGQTVRYIERMASRIIDEDDSSTWFFVDAGVQQKFTNPVTTISGLTWLEGQTVAVLADGGVQSEKVVTGGAITLDHAAKVITVGLPYVSDLGTLPATLQIDAFGQGRTKNINKAWLKVYQSSQILMGPDLDDLIEIPQRTTEPFGSPPALVTEELEVLITPDWQQEGQTFIRQVEPLPLSVVGLTMEVVIGG